MTRKFVFIDILSHPSPHPPPSKKTWDPFCVVRSKNHAAVVFGGNGVATQFTSMNDGLYYPHVAIYGDRLTQAASEGCG